MADTLTSDGPTTGLADAADAADAAETRVATAAPVNDILRDIARGGIAGILVGIFVAGLGGRLVMRLATILHEDTVGRTTEAGETIGEISFSGTMALITFGGLGMGLMAGVIWVIARPWIPGRGLRLALLTGLLAVALGTPALVQGANVDFIILDYDPLVVGLLVGLVFAVGFSIAIVDGWLDRHLPRPLSGVGKSTVVYAVVTVLGVFLILPLVIAILLDQPDYRATIRAGWALAAAGFCTLAWWVLRLRGRTSPPRALAVAGGLSLLLAAALGVVTSLPHIRAALGSL